MLETTAKVTIFHKHYRLWQKKGDRNQKLTEGSIEARARLRLRLKTRQNTSVVTCWFYAVNATKSTKHLQVSILAVSVIILTILYSSNTRNADSDFTCVYWRVRRKVNQMFIVIFKFKNLELLILFFLWYRSYFLIKCWDNFHYVCNLSMLYRFFSF